MAVDFLNLFITSPLFYLILMNEYVTVISSFSHGCSRSWYLTYDNSSIDNYTITVEPDQVYNLRSPQLYKLTYPTYSLFTWHVDSYEPNSMSLMMYLLFIKTESYCDIVRLEVDDNPIDITNKSVKNTESTTAYWSGSFEYSYDYKENKKIFLSMHYLEGHHAVVQFNTDHGWTDVGFMIRMLPLLENRSKVEGGALKTRLSANSSLKQLELKPGPVHQEIKETVVIIKAANLTSRVMVHVLFMNLEHVSNCNQNFIKIFDGVSREQTLMTACRNMNTTTQPVQAVSLSNKLIIKYRCTTRQLYNQRQKVYTPSPCAILNFQIYNPEDYEDKLYDSEDFLEYKYADVPKLLEFNGQYVRFSVKSFYGVTLNFQSEKYEDTDDTASVHLYSKIMSPTAPLFISHKLHGETPSYSEYKIATNALVNGNSFKDFWIAFNKDKITVGWGHELRTDKMLNHPLTGNLQLKYYVIKMFGPATVRVYSESMNTPLTWKTSTNIQLSVDAVTITIMQDCDENFLSQTTQLPLAPSSIEHTVSKGSVYSRIWTIRKEFPTQILQFRVKTNLLHNPDCEWEGLTIYRGGCLSWRKKVAVYCGKIEEFVSETTHSVVVIQFHTRADYTAENTFHGDARRYFMIKYKVYSPDQDASEEDGINIGLVIAVILSVVIIFLVVVVVFYLQVVKKKARKVTTEKILPPYPEQKVAHSQQIQHQSPAQPIRLHINIDNASQMAGVPNVIYDSGTIKTSVNYTGIPPPAVYEPPTPSFSQNPLPRVQTVQPAK